MDLVMLTEHVGYLPGVTNIGFILCPDKGAILIDSGLEDSHARKASKLLQEAGFVPKAVVNTHAHADHFGGNNWLKQHFQVLCAAPKVESALIENPIWEPIFLFSGALPPKELQHKLFCAKNSCKVDDKWEPGETSLEICGVSLELVSLPGHSPQHTGIAYEGVLFCGDALLSVETLEKHTIPFLYDMDLEYSSLDFLERSSFAFYCPSHGKPVQDPKAEIEAMRHTLCRLTDLILESLQLAPKTGQQITAEVLCRLGAHVDSPTLFWLDSTGIMGILSSLYRQGKVLPVMDENLALWKHCADTKGAD